MKTDLSAFNVFRLSREIFSKMMRATYSIFNVNKNHKTGSKMQRKIMQHIASILTRTGINILNLDDLWARWRFAIIFTSYLTVPISNAMLSITNINDISAFVEPTDCLAGCISVLTGSYFLFHYKKIIGEMMHQMDENFYTYPDEDLIQIEYPWFLQDANITMFLKLVKYFMFWVIFMLSAPVIAEVIFYGRISTFIYPCWTPWKLDSLQIDLFTYALQFYQGSCGLVLLYTVSSFLLVTVTEFMRQYHRLKAAVSSIEYRASVLQKEMRGGFDEALRQNIIHCILHHQVLRRHFQTFKIWFTIFFSIELSVSVVTFALALYTMINVPHIGELTSHVTTEIFIWINILIRCLVSDIFSDLNESLAKNILWEAPWYKTNKGNTTLLIMFHSAACQPLRLYGLLIFEANRVTFAKLVRVTYSFFNVLKVSVKK